EHTMSPEVLVVSKRVWETLSAEDKSIFREAEIAGVNVVTLADRSGFERAVAGLVERFAGEPGLAALVERIRQAQ
uniref:hypothetical protein n=1 Tax=Klebsiella pneumoniae TaxID=573 RepID=UPI001953EC90